jgi:hypothetical protein
MGSLDDSLQAALRTATKANKSRDAAAVVQALEEALAHARRDAPLAVRVAVPILHDHVGLGLYTPAPAGRVEGRRVRLYVEVANFGLTAIGEGRARAQLDVTGEFAYEDGAELVALPAVSLGTQSFETRSPDAVTSFGVELKLGDKSPAGVYRLKLVVKDAVLGKSGSRETRFVLADGGAGRP